MSWSWTLYRYLAVPFPRSVMVVFGAFAAARLFHRHGRSVQPHGRPQSPAPRILVGMALLQLPDLGQKLLPFAVLLGGVFAFARLSRSQELVATRAAGISAWDFLRRRWPWPSRLGFFTVAAYQRRLGVHAARNLRAWRRKYIQRRGLAARRVAERLVAAPGRRDAAIGDPCAARHRSGRPSGGRHRLSLRRPGSLRGPHRRRHAPISKARRVASCRCLGERRRGHARASRALRSSHRRSRRRRSRKASRSPDTLSFWELPGFIARAERRLLRHALPALLYSLLALPALFAAMVFMAASFASGSAAAAA